MHKILVADDEPIELTVVEKIINENLSDKVSICLADNGREAVDLYEKENCDIALLDIAMPGLNGLEAAEIIRARHPGHVIIFLTAFDEFDYAKKAIAVKALDYLLKPVDEKELILVLEEALGQVEKETTGSPAENRTIDNTEFSDMKMSAIRTRISDYLENRYMDDISLSDIAGELKYSDAYFSKVFKKCFNKGFIVYLTELRIEKSKILLEDIFVNIKDISAKVGFRDSNYYTKVFKRMEGLTPSEYRIMKGIHANND
ncbi:MAG: response regulator [Lachnospiraceae bacterium]|nr:response regulator [Lachnospiraceae bacterium]